MGHGASMETRVCCNRDRVRAVSVPCWDTLYWASARRAEWQVGSFLRGTVSFVWCSGETVGVSPLSAKRQ